MKKKIVMLLLATVVLSTSLTGCTIGNTEFVLDSNSAGGRHVFSINGVKCTKEEARLYLCNYQNLYGKEYGLNLWEYDFSNMDTEVSLENYVKEITLAELANITCMQLLAEERGIALTEEELTLVEKAADEYYASLTKDEISYIGFDKKELVTFYEKYATAQKLYKTLTQGVNEEISIDEARVMRIQQIYVTDKAIAQTVEQKLAEGEDFATVASTYNEKEAIEINLARDTYPKAVEDIAFHLEDGEQSCMIEAENGYYFIKCLNKYDEALTEENKENVIIKRRKEQFDDVYEKFIENSDFDLNEKVWEGIEPDTSGSITTDSFFEIYEKYFTE